MYFRFLRLCDSLDLVFAICLRLSLALIWSSVKGSQYMHGSAIVLRNKVSRSAACPEHWYVSDSNSESDCTAFESRGFLH